MRACLFGTYNRQHSANRIYARAIQAAGYEVVECHSPVWEHTRDKDADYFSPRGLLRGGLAWLRAAFALARRWRKGAAAPVAVVGFNGQLDVVLLRLLAPRYGPRIVFAPLVSLSETLVEDRHVYARGSLAARWLRWLDRLTCRLADVVVVDSHAHKRYFSEILGVEGERIEVCHLGADNGAFGPVAHAQGDARDERPGPADAAGGDGRIEVLYFGQYLPLHGLDVVADAVAQLARSRDDLHFVFIGTGEQRPIVERAVLGIGASAEFVDWVAYDQLAERIGQADIVLGVFGRSAKARMVIPNKVYEAAAVGRPVITLNSEAVREVFTDGEDIVLCAADSLELAAAVERLADDPAERTRIGQAAQTLMAERFSDEALGRAWRRALVATPALAFDDAAVRVGIVVLNFDDAATTLRCLDSLAQSDYTTASVIVVDNGSRPAELERLETAMAGRYSATLMRLPVNCGYAGGNNAALAKLFEDGADYVLVLNNDTIVTPGAVRALVACALTHPDCGPVGPRVARGWPGAPAASLGERYWAPLAWLPRSLLRRRRLRQRCYPVGGVLGCALLISRSLYEHLGGFDEDYFAYYEEVDYCLRARRLGYKPRVEPAAEISHRGHRGFGAGMNTTAAYLKARNLWLLGRRRAGLLGSLLFVPGYFAMIGASMLGYWLRGRRDLVAAMRAGVAAALDGQAGQPPAWIFPSGARP